MLEDDEEVPGGEIDSLGYGWWLAVGLSDVCLTDVTKHGESVIISAERSA